MNNTERKFVPSETWDGKVFYIDEPGRFVASKECIGCKERENDVNACTHCPYMEPRYNKE